MIPGEDHLRDLFERQDRLRGQAIHHMQGTQRAQMLRDRWAIVENRAKPLTWFLNNESRPEHMTEAQAGAAFLALFHAVAELGSDFAYCMRTVRDVADALSAAEKLLAARPDRESTPD
ncbi:hypothetical protein [Crossiella sp. CA198]|uniref:hypothetical protein n=1 Tax=Crossiella sp. CA198 TaxID=3455607 RepID=UPI003F8D4F14